MQAIGIHGAFASAAKIASRRLEDAGDPAVADRLDKLDRWHAARRRGYDNVARVLIAARANVKAKVANGVTPLLMAAFSLNFTG